MGLKQTQKPTRTRKGIKMSEAGSLLDNKQNPIHSFTVRRKKREIGRLLKGDSDMLITGNYTIYE